MIQNEGHNATDSQKTFTWLAFSTFSVIILICAGLYTYFEYTFFSPAMPLNLQLSIYQDAGSSLWEKLANRVETQPFNLVAFLIFLCAVIHTFFANRINAYAHQLRESNIRQGKKVVDTFAVEFLRFMGEVEIVFGFWVIPLLLAITYFYDWRTAVHYLEHRSYTEPLFVVVIMTVAATRPILAIAEKFLRSFAKIGGSTPQAWWWAILTLGPLSGSLITEPGAMTISALLLSKQFYCLKPSKQMAYATIGLLFVNVSVGGVLTNFAAPPVLLVAKAWGWSTLFMFTTFGIKAILGIVISNGVYYLYFRDEFKELEKKQKQLERKHADHEGKDAIIPFWVCAIHCVFLFWIVVHVHHPVIFIGSLLLFLGFHQATLTYQNPVELKTPILVGFFLAGLVVHGGLQGWWISPLLADSSHHLLMGLSLFLTSFNDNAAITYLASLIPDFDDMMKYAVMVGAVSGGGLTVIANAPNPSGQAILNKYFDGGIAMLDLLKGAAIPTLIITMSFYLLR